MSSSSDHSWTKGELYQLLCLLGIAECIWLTGVKLELFAWLHELTLRYALSDLVMLASIMSVALTGAAAYRSVRLRREMAWRAEAEEQAQTLARHDALTGLPNRRLLAEAIHHASAILKHPHAVLLIDLDRFKPVNDVHGHTAGDSVLCETATRIKALVQSGVAARLGGDEFAVLVSYTGRARS